MRLRLALGAILMVTAGCSGAATPGGFVLEEYTIGVPGASFDAGSVTLEIENVGEFPHTMVITAEDGRAIAATETIAAGGSTELVVELQPGTYQVSCRIVVQLPDGTIVDHYEAGMVARFAVTDR